ncbi:Zn(2)-Cys(6) binuclear cluster domain-containing protein [Mycena polygramma]|nr:Zn(2)-Cys(6) binuclear cluster domain-containing protein [Mycena polygramma]
MATTSSSLSRGQACFSCKRRKMKCDGAKPICGQCERGRRREDCEYTQGQGRARVEILQESISRVESRIYELEHPHENQQLEVQLRQPYQASSCPTHSEHRAAADEPPLDILQKLVDLFLSYSSEFGFFLNRSRFRASALLRQPIGHHARPTPALLSAVYLWGLRLSQQAPLIAQEPIFLSRALDFTAKGLSGNHPQKIMHNLQAEILLAYYFFSSGRFLEGKYHTASAMSLGLSSGLHMVRSANGPASSLPPPNDAIEEGERIHACWSGVILDKAWAVALSENPHLDHHRQNYAVDTPWPLEMDDYERGSLNPTALYSNTLDTFVNGVSIDTGMSTIAMLSKASVLWQRADHLARNWKLDMSQNESTVFQNSFVALDGLIDRFRAALIPPNRIPFPTPAMTRALVVSHSIAHTSAIQLHTIALWRADPNSRRKSLVAATSILNIIVSVPLQHFALINPIMGTVWLTACQVLVDEIYEYRTQRAASRPGGEESQLMGLLTRTADVLSSLAGTCPLLKYQITRIQEACAEMQS